MNYGTWAHACVCDVYFGGFVYWHMLMPSGSYFSFRLLGKLGLLNYLSLIYCSLNLPGLVIPALLGPLCRLFSYILDSAQFFLKSETESTLRLRNHQLALSSPPWSP